MIFITVRRVFVAVSVGLGPRVAFSCLSLSALEAFGPLFLLSDFSAAQAPLHRRRCLSRGYRLDDRVPCVRTLATHSPTCPSRSTSFWSSVAAGCEGGVGASADGRDAAAHNAEVVGATCSAEEKRLNFLRLGFTTWSVSRLASGSSPYTGRSLTWRPNDNILGAAATSIRRIFLFGTCPRQF